MGLFGFFGNGDDIDHGANDREPWEDRDDPEGEANGDYEQEDDDYRSSHDPD